MHFDLSMPLPPWAGLYVDLTLSVTLDVHSFVTKSVFSNLCNSKSERTRASKLSMNTYQHVNMYT